MLTILLYGKLGKKFGKVHKYNVSSVAEAIRALCATIKGFKEDLNIGSYKVLDGSLTSYNEKQLDSPISNRNTLRIVPVIEGAGGGGGIFNIVLGAILIYVSMGGASSLLVGWGASTGAAAGVMSFGISMVLGGVSSLLFSPDPVQQSSYESVENAPSFAFNGAINTTQQGNPVPVCYGKLIVGSQVISAGLSVEQTTV
jgi:predicted phage tail protein